MQPEIHCIVKQPQDFYLALSLIRSDPEQNEMPTLVASSRHMQCEQSPPNLAPLSSADCCRSSGERHESIGKGVRINARLQITELSQCPSDNILEVRFGGCGKLDSPLTFFRGHPPLSARFFPDSKSSRTVRK
jgi:hypothetical protein